MQAQDFIRVIGYGTAAIVSVAGIAIMVGLILPSYIPDNFRVVVGIILVLYGIYRMASLWGKQRNAKRREE
jgi:hypothetical protein